MWLFDKIPKIIHFYWGCNKKMSYLRHLSIKSFIKYNPSWKVILHLPYKVCTSDPCWRSIEQKGKGPKIDYLDKILDSSANIVKHDFEEYGFLNDIHEIYKNDFLRWMLLYRIGGVWSDTDIIYVKSINNLTENSLVNKDVDTVLCKYRTGSNAIGFLMSSIDNQFFKEISLATPNIYHPFDYQSIGANILNKLYDMDPDIESFFFNNHFLNIDPNSVYSIDCNFEGVNRFFDKNYMHKDMPGVIGYHWYAGYPLSQKYESFITEKNYKKYNIYISKIIELVEK